MAHVLGAFVTFIQNISSNSLYPKSLPIGKIICVCHSHRSGPVFCSFASSTSPVGYLQTFQG